MYTVLMLLVIGLGLWMAISGGLARKKIWILAGITLAAATVLFFWFMGFWGEMLWFDSLGYSERFWDVFRVRFLAGAVGMAAAVTLVFLLTVGYSSENRLFRYAAMLIAGAVGLSWGGNWEIILRFLHGVPTELRDPIFDNTVGFYLFTLPIIDSLKNQLFFVAAIVLAATAADAYLSIDREKGVVVMSAADTSRIGGVYRAAGVVLLVMAYAMFLRRYHLMYSNVGPITGPGWTDVNVRLPGIMVMIGVLLLSGAVLLVAPLRKMFVKKAAGLSKKSVRHAYILGGVFVVIFGLQGVVISFIPSMFQRFRVEPNEITFERPYISNNISFTRHGFNLQNVEEKEYPAHERFTRDMVENNQSIFSNIRLWDWRALDAVYKQFQEIRLYYEFADVDVDRYTIDGDYRQVMVSAREMELNNLPTQSRTFVNHRFKYTHGYGITMTNVSEFTEQGLPNLLIRDIPPKSRYEDITVERPEIYYGELTRDPALVNTREEEFDYPRGEENAYVRYQGEGGVKLRNLWRKFLFGWKYDGMQLFLSGYPTSDSRIMFHRQIEERAAILAPFLEFDDDPYVVLADGRLYWIIDAYTTSEFYPYSERFVPQSGLSPIGDRQALYSQNQLGRFEGSNYVRNSVKMVIDAYDGSVDIYIFDDSDPLIQTWQEIFPDMFKSRKEMPEKLRSHVRYPIDMLLLQGLVYAKYHMTDPTVFYNQEDLWVRATEKYYDKVQPVEPYYIMWELPESDHPQFVLMLPFTPKNRQVSIGWIAGMCDGDNYGRFLAYKFPKERRILGPQQVETKIDQDRFLSGQLTLWDQGGSRVIRGNVLAIPLEQTLIYVEPIYLQAETAAYPELRLVAVMHDDHLSYAESFEKALEGLFTDSGPTALGTGLSEQRSAGELIRSANDSFTNYLKAMGEKQFQQATDALDLLQTLLQQLEDQYGQEQNSAGRMEKGQKNIE